MEPINTVDHFSRLIMLLELEAEAEKQANLLDFQRSSPAAAEQNGISLTNLVIRDESGGMGGRILLTFGKRNQNLSLPWTRLGSGSPVILSEEGNRDGVISGWRGVVTRLTRDSIQAAFSDWPETESERPVFRLDRSTDEISRQRQRKGLEKAKNAATNRLGELRDILLCIRPPVFHPTSEISIFNKGLNKSQTDAVKFALSASDAAIIHGPPGTGKTTTLVELIRQILKRGERVLALAPSNIAVDNLLEKLIKSGEAPIRLGHPARVLPELRDHTLDQLVENHPEMKVVQRLFRESRALRAKASRYTRAKPEPGERKALRDEAKQMIAEARKLEDLITERLLNSTRIVCATLTGLDQDVLREQQFDWCIVDEASQATEAAAWVPLQISSKLVLAGDPFQLPPTIISPEAEARGFGVSLMERLMKNYGNEISSLLSVQYRMHSEIMEFSSREFYGNFLTASQENAAHLLSGLDHVIPGELTNCPIHFIDTAGANFEESEELEGESRLNIKEAQLSQKYVQILLDSGVHPAGIGVITPYSAQVRYLRDLIKNSDIEIDSVDGFQGREKEAIIFSMVRSNHESKIGFLGDTRRMNVAMTRARRKLIVIGDSATITVNPFYDRMVTYFESITSYHSVWDGEL